MLTTTGFFSQQRTNSTRFLIKKPRHRKHYSVFNMSIRVITKIFLTIQLLLLVFRQLIDFAGIQWLMIIVNAISIIVTIAAFFGHLVFYALFQVFLIVYNVYVICVYARILKLNTEITVQSVDGQNGILTSSIINDGQSSDIHSSSVLPTAQLLSFDSNSRSFWYVIVSNHISNIQTHLNQLSSSSSSSSLFSNVGQQKSSVANSADHLLRHPTSSIDDSLVDICVQYVEIAIALLHIFFALLGIGLIALKYKLERDKFVRNNDKTTPPLPPYTITPQMNHYMSFTPSTSTSKGGSIYNQNSSVRRSSKRRRSTRSLHNQKSKSHSLGALNIRSSTGSLKSLTKQGQHRKSATSLLMMNQNTTDSSFNTLGSRSGTDRKSQRSKANNKNEGIYGTIMNNSSSSSHYQPKKQQSPLNSSYHHQVRQPSNQHSILSQRQSTMMNGVNKNSSAAQHVAKLLNSDSETDYYHTFTPAYYSNGLTNPLYGNRNSYLDSSETAI